jgi:hypothetical protein
MQKIFIIVAVAALAATAMPFQVHQAQAYCRGCAVGAGAIGGIAAGALIGSAIANSQAQAQAQDALQDYAPPPPPPGIEPADLPNESMDSAACHFEQQSVANEYGMRRWQTVEVCE